MHVAVDKAGSAEGKKFTEYIDDLEAKGYITIRLADGWASSVLGVVSSVASR
jgi:hypothetical protein